MVGIFLGGGVCWGCVILHNTNREYGDGAISSIQYFPGCWGPIPKRSIENGISYHQILSIPRYTRGSPIGSYQENTKLFVKLIAKKNTQHGFHSMSRVNTQHMHAFQKYHLCKSYLNSGV